MSYHIGPEVQSSTTLPATAYRDPGFFAAQQAQIFARSWQWIARVQAADPLKVEPFQLLPDCLSEPLLLSCDSAGQWHCLSNVCTHRGSLICTHPGQPKTLQCPYHGRCFNHQGKMLSMPEFEGTENFPSAADHLQRLPLETWKGFWFTNLDPYLDFREWILPLEKRLAWMPIENFVHLPEEDKDYLLEANWMLYCDNYLEGFHVPYIHPGLAKVLDYKAYEIHPLPWGVLQIGLAKPGEAAFELPEQHPDQGKQIAAYYFWLFPNLMLNFYPWGLSLNLITPVALNQTRISYRSYLWDADKRGQGAGAAPHQVEAEDQAIIGLVGQGIQSRLYKQGRYSARREAGVHRFHQLICELAQNET